MAFGCRGKAVCSGISARGREACVDVPRSGCTVLVLAGKEAGSRLT